ncbi:hypothetical protein [Roseivirga sp. E12]|uniref:hypothetical protein n=1 Tax=Roseivirga sp. E12 TaxID=2819237 RepID=UPI001ABC279F|nr:hypothetical protein [Roseivirga sp. E12]MBO3699524.1 hypothetical protein [Roseivirga sp. E12]
MKSSTSVLIFSLFTFLFGLVVLVFFNPNALQELKNLPLTALNLQELELRSLIALFLYIIPGGLIIVFSLQLFMNSPNGVLLYKLVKVLVLLSGLLWLVLGFLPYSPFNENEYPKLVFLTVVFLTIVLLILLILTISFGLIFKQKQIFNITLIATIIVFSLTFLSLFVLNSDTWIRTNLSIGLYFIWLVALGYFFEKREPESKW